MSDPKPYVNGAMLSDFIGQHVSVIGKIVNVSSSMMQLEIQMCDGKKVKVQLEEALEEQLEGFVQMIARVNRDQTLICQNLISFGAGEIDMDTYNNAINVMGRHQNLFSSGEVNGMVPVSYTHLTLPTICSV